MSMNTAETIQAEAVTITDAAALAGSSTSTQYISEWRHDSQVSQRSHSVVFTHKLGKIPTSLLVLFSSDKNTVFPIQWGSAGYSGNPVTISMDSQVITLEIYYGGGLEFLHGVWSASTGAWISYPSGHWRVIASA
jgi:uncharacterized protein YycO